MKLSSWKEKYEEHFKVMLGQPKAADLHAILKKFGFLVTNAKFLRFLIGADGATEEYVA